ncbi:hypothetical protein [Bradyrhizobium prioriisuperbiae]|uniref:hypothetical protein n=1 Tax=Bradyrhizobium prioriisuperbiae TaxID=2854389 RepID=UPI0028ED4615|nr:hypothetical protein [Bradyrhizobium prioritasuperba]
MADRKGDETKRPSNCGRRDGQWKPCPNLKEIDPRNMSGETYSCNVCGEHYYLDYEEMR